VGLLVAFLLLFPFGYLVHVSPRFPGSLAGGIIGIAALVLMLLTLPYVAAKHIAWVDKALSRVVSKPTLLAIHIYAGVLAPILGLVHAAHKLESPVGLLLTVLLLMTVITGFIGRYLPQLGRALRGRRSELASLRAAFLEEPAAPTQADTAAPPLSGWKRYLFVAGDASAGQRPQDKAGIAAALADTEFAIRAEEATNTLFARWRFLHILLGCLIFALLALHVGAAIYYGLRWL
jgi:predicted ferric reductase